MEGREKTPDRQPIEMLRLQRRPGNAESFGDVIEKLREIARVRPRRVRGGAPVKPEVLEKLGELRVHSAIAATRSARGWRGSRSLPCGLFSCASIFRARRAAP